MSFIYFVNEEGTWNSSPGTPLIPSSIEMGIVYNTQISTSTLSRAVKTQELPGARWRCRMAFNDLTPEETRPLLAWLSDLRGSAGRFVLYDFSLPDPRGGLTSANYTLPSRTTITLSNRIGGDLEVGDLISIKPNNSDIMELKMIVEKFSPTSYRFEPTTKWSNLAYPSPGVLNYTSGLGPGAYSYMMLTGDDQSSHSTAEKGLISNIVIDAVEVPG